MMESYQAFCVFLDNPYSFIHIISPKTCFGKENGL